MAATPPLLPPSRVTTPPRRPARVLSLSSGLFGLTFLLFFRSRDLFHWIRTEISCRLPVSICQSDECEAPNCKSRFLHEIPKRNLKCCIIYKCTPLQNHLQRIQLSLKFLVQMLIPEMVDSKSQIWVPSPKYVFYFVYFFFEPNS